MMMHSCSKSGYHSLYDWYHSKEGEHFPDPAGLRSRIERWTFGLYPACIKYLMAAFDVPEVNKVTPMINNNVNYIIFSNISKDVNPIIINIYLSDKL